MLERRLESLSNFNYWALVFVISGDLALQIQYIQLDLLLCFVETLYIPDR